MNIDKLRDLLTGTDFRDFHKANGKYDRRLYARVVVHGATDLDAVSSLRVSIAACANADDASSQDGGTRGTSRAAARRLLDAWPLDS